jgi:DNA polymerase-4
VVIGGRREHAPRDTPTGPPLRPAARLHRPRRHHHRHLRGTRVRRALGAGLMKAAALAPDCLLLPTDFDLPRHERRFKAAVARSRPIEDRGIDEIYIDLSELPRQRRGRRARALAGLKEVAQEIKQRARRHRRPELLDRHGAQQAAGQDRSELDKPDGLTLIRPRTWPARIWPLPVRASTASGRRRREGWRRSASTPSATSPPPTPLAASALRHPLRRWLHEAAHGRDDRPVVTHSEPVSISRETTFERDLHAAPRPRRAGPHLHPAVRAARRRPRARATRARTIGIKLRFDDFKSVTRDRSCRRTRSTRAPSAARRANA